MTYLLGIDIGTSSAKALLFDVEQAAVAAVAGVEYPMQHPYPGYAEQNPDDWWQAVVESVRRVVNILDGQPDIAGIGLTGQMHGFTPLDEQNNILHPAIIWADQRSAGIIDDLTERVGYDTFINVAGTLPAAGFMASTLFWMQQNDPALLARISKVILPKDYIQLRLTGAVATDTSDAAATALFDVTAGKWSESIISTLKFPPDIFPDVHLSTDVIGQLDAGAADALNLRPGIPVVAGCADQPAQSIANGVLEPGIVSVTTGTGGQVSVPLRIKDGFKTDPRVHVFNHAVPGSAYILGAILSAGLSLRWLRDTVGLKNTPNAYDRLSQDAATVPPGAEGLIFLPYLVGERTPLMDPEARGAFIGLSTRHGRGHLARAVMEGVTFALRQALEVSLSLSPTPVTQIIAAGGGAESTLWRGIQTDVFNLPLQKSLLTEQTGIGAAMLAGIGTGVYSGFDEAVAAVAHYDEPTIPRSENRVRYDDLYQHFTELYPRLRDDFHRLVR